MYIIYGYINYSFLRVFFHINKNSVCLSNSIKCPTLATVSVGPAGSTPAKRMSRRSTGTDTASNVAIFRRVRKEKFLKRQSRVN